MRTDQAAILDSNVVLEAVKHGDNAEACEWLLRQVGDGSIRVIVEPIVVHELTYVIPRYLKQATRPQIARIILSVLQAPGAEDPTGMLVTAVRSWRDTQGQSFVDAYLATVARAQRRTVLTLNTKDFEPHGVDAPDLRELMGTG